MVFTRVITIEGAPPLNKGSDGHKACAAWISTALSSGDTRRRRRCEVPGRQQRRRRQTEGHRRGLGSGEEPARSSTATARLGSASLAPRSRPAWSISPPRRVAPPARPPRRFTTIWQLQNKPASWLSDWLPSPPPPQRLRSSPTVASGDYLCAKDLLIQNTPPTAPQPPSYKRTNKDLWCNRMQFP